MKVGDLVRAHNKAQTIGVVVCVLKHPAYRFLPRRKCAGGGNIMRRLFQRL